MMNYTPQERLVRLWELAAEDPDCQACQKELLEAKEQLERSTARMDRSRHDRYWRYPVCTHTFFGRVLELAAREMRFPEET